MGPYRRLSRGAGLLLLVLLLTGVSAEEVAHGAAQGLWPGRDGAVAAVSAPEQGPWTIDYVEKGRWFGWMGPRMLAFDAAGRPHMAYGIPSLYYAWHDGTRWHLETPDPTGGVGSYTALALDAAGHPHIAYYQYTGGDLRYAHFDGTAWHYETVDAAGDVGQFTAITVDAAGHPHISYYDYTGGNLKYARFDGAAWHVETVDSYGNTGRGTALVLDAAGRPHIFYSYAEFPGACLKHAYFDGTAWSLSTVDDDLYPGAYVSAALDTAGRPHLAYQEQYNRDLRYAYFDGTTWHIQTVDTEGYTGYFTSLAVDAAGRPHISYYDDFAEAVKYAYLDDTGWNIQTMGRGVLTGGFTSIAMGPGNWPCLAYGPGIALQYTCYDGAAWHVETVDYHRHPGYESSLVLDAWGRPHIAARNAGNLDYAYRDGQGWRSVVVDGTGNIGYFSSLALDGAGHPHISYDAWYPDYALRYAHDDGTGWITQTVDSTGAIPSGDCLGYTSLALDANGHPHISYRNGEADELRYAFFDGTRWQTETVDSSGDVGGYTSLALDAAGHPHIGYCEYTPGDYWFCRRLKYAVYDGTTWHVTYVGNAAGDYLSMALDAQGRAHFSYYNPGSGALEYARPTEVGSSSWEVETVDASGTQGTGAWSSLALDAAGHPHISYCQYTEGFFECGALRYAYHDGTAWHLETIESGPFTGYNTSIALDAAGRPHISYRGDHALKYATPCVALQGARIAGPTAALMGISTTYTAVYTPALATPPITTTWDNGASGPAAHYTWPETGTYTLALTATGRCSGTAVATFTVSVFCQPAAAVQVAGPQALLVGQVGIYAAAALPITTSPPITFTWDNGTVGPSAAYSWSLPGSYTLTVTAANRCGEGIGSLPVRVWEKWPYSMYLPLVYRE